MSVEKVELLATADCVSCTFISFPGDDGTSIREATVLPKPRFLNGFLTTVNNPGTDLSTFSWHAGTGSDSIAFVIPDLDQSTTTELVSWFKDVIAWLQSTSAPGAVFTPFKIGYKI